MSERSLQRPHEKRQRRKHGESFFAHGLTIGQYGNHVPSMLIADLLFSLAIACLLSVLYEGVYRQNRLESRSVWTDVLVFFAGILIATWSGVLWARKLGRLWALLPVGATAVVFVIFAVGSGMLGRRERMDPGGTGGLSVSVMRSMGIWIVFLVLAVVLTVSYFVPYP